MNRQVSINTFKIFCSYFILFYVIIGCEFFYVHIYFKNQHLCNKITNRIMKVIFLITYKIHFINLTQIFIFNKIFFTIKLKFQNNHQSV